jgi:hypothetical protein
MLVSQPQLDVEINRFYQVVMDLVGDFGEDAELDMVREETHEFFDAVGLGAPDGSSDEVAAIPDESLLSERELMVQRLYREDFRCGERLDHQALAESVCGWFSALGFKSPIDDEDWK